MTATIMPPQPADPKRGWLARRSLGVGGLVPAVLLAAWADATGNQADKPRLLAEHCIADYKLLSDPDTGILYRWNGIFWEIFDEDHIKAVAIRCMGNEAQKSRIEDAIYQVKMLSTIPPDLSRSPSAILSMSSSAPSARLPWPIRITAFAAEIPFS